MAPSHVSHEMLNMQCFTAGYFYPWRGLMRGRLLAFSGHLSNGSNQVSYLVEMDYARRQCIVSAWRRLIKSQIDFKTTQAVKWQEEGSILCFVRQFLEKLSGMLECDGGQLRDWLHNSAASDRDSRSFQHYPWLQASAHEGKSIISNTRWSQRTEQTLDVTRTGLCIRKLSSMHLTFFYLDSAWRLPPHCVIEKPVPCHYTRTVWLPGRASASSSGPALNSLRQALADCSETENPWLAENNKYPWEAARWTFTVSLAGEGEICQTSH